MKSEPGGRVKVAVAGLGSFGRLHALAYSQNAGAVLSAVCDSDPKKAQLVGRSLGVARRYTDFDTMLEKEDAVDLVSIATPDAQHFPMAMKAARKGKAILLEKPMCSTLADAERLADAAESTGVKLMVDFILRFDPRYLKGRELLISGKLGRIATIYARRHVQARFGKGHARFSNLFVDVAIHDIDMCMWYTGSRPFEVYGAAPGKGNDAVFGIMRFPEGEVAVVDANWLTPDRNKSVVEGEMRVLCDKGKVEIRTDQQGVEYATNVDGPTAPDLSLWSLVDGRVFGDLKESVDHIVSCVRFDRQPAVGPADGLRALRVALKLRESMREGRVLPISW